MGGTNDLAQGYTKDQILSNIKSMAEQAAAKDMKVVLCSVTPCNMTYSRLSPKEKGTHIVALNKMIKGPQRTGIWRSHTAPPARMPQWNCYARRNRRYW